MSNISLNVVADVDMTGSLIVNSQFSTPANITMSALAMDVDHTLWMVGHPLNNGIFSFYHYNTDGTLIGAFEANPALTNPIGGEIAFSSCMLCPEPSSLVLFAAGAPAFFVGKRRVAKTQRMLL